MIRKYRSFKLYHVEEKLNTLEEEPELFKYFTGNVLFFNCSIRIKLLTIYEDVLNKLHQCH